MITQSVNLTYGGVNYTVFNRPVQQITLLDSTNQQFLRQVMLSNDGVKLIRGQYTIQFPMEQLYAVAAQAMPSMSWSPVIDTQPLGSQFVTVPGTASLSVVAEDEFNTVKYQWYVSASEAGTGWQLTVNTTNIKFKNTSSAEMSASYGIGFTPDTSSYFCLCSNASGEKSSSIGYVLPQ